MSNPSSVFASMLRSTGVYAIGIVAQRIVGLLLLPLYTSYLTPADYGILELIDVTISVFSLVVGARVATAVAYFCGQASGDRGHHSVFSTNLFGCTLLSLFAILAGYLIAPRLGPWIATSGEASSALFLAVAGLAAGFPLESYLGRLRVQDQPAAFTVIGLVRLVLSVALNILFLAVFHLGYRSILLSNLLVSGLLSLYAALDTRRLYGMRIDWRLFLSMLRFAVPVGVVGLSLFVFHVADRFFLKRFATLDQIGLYALGYKFGMLIAYFQMAFNQYWHAKGYDILKSGQGQAVFSRGFTYYTIAMGSAALATWLFAPPAIHFLVQPAFYPAVQFVPLILAAYFIRSLADYVRMILYSAQRPSLDAWSNAIAALFCLAAYALLIPRYGAQGAAWATLLTSIVMAATAGLFARRLRPLGLETSRLVRIFASAAAAIGLYSILPAGGITLHALAIATCLSLYLALLWLWVLNDSDRAGLLTVLPRRGPAAP